VFVSLAVNVFGGSLAWRTVCTVLLPPLLREGEEKVGLKLEWLWKLHPFWSYVRFGCSPSANSTVCDTFPFIAYAVTMWSSKKNSRRRNLKLITNPEKLVVNSQLAKMSRDSTLHMPRHACLSEIVEWKNVCSCTAYQRIVVRVFCCHFQVCASYVKEVCWQAVFSKTEL